MYIKQKNKKVPSLLRTALHAASNPANMYFSRQWHKYVRTLCSSNELQADTGKNRRKQVKHAVRPKMSFHVGGTAELEPAPSLFPLKELK